MIALVLGFLVLTISSAVLVPILDEPNEPTFDRTVGAALVVVCLGIVYLLAFRAAGAIL